MKKRGKLLTVLLIIFMLDSSILLKAQPPIDDDDVLDNPVPFDGGVSLLVAAAIGYGLKKSHHKKKAGTI